MPITARHFSVRGLWTTSHKISTVSCLRLACCMNYLI
jgi:hypothetical protein